MSFLPKWAWWTIGIVAGLIVIGALAPAEEEDGGEDGKAGSTPYKIKKDDPPEKVSTEDIDLDAETMADLFANEEQFCRAYARALSAGLGEDFAFGNFLRGYQAADVPEGAASAREVFDELVSRC